MDLIQNAAIQGKPMPCSVIDTHTHVLPSNNGGYWCPTAGIDSFVQRMDRLGIDCSIATISGMTLGHTMEEINSQIQAIAREHEGRIYAHLFILPQEGLEQTRGQIKKYAADPHFIGFKFLTGYHGSLLQPEYRYAMDFALEAKCPVMFHNWGGKPGTAAAAKALKDRPELKLISAHYGGGTASYTKEYWEMMQDYPNAKMDVCGGVSQSMTMDDLVALTGADRWVFGTDSSLHDPAYDLCRVALCNLEESRKRQIFVGNYLALLEDSQLGKIYLPE